MIKSLPLKVTRSIWDLSTLLKWVETHLPSVSSFFEISRRLALILLLTSGRKVHDLTLLQIDSDHLQRSQSSIVFWPKFGSKSDSSSFMQSGWQFSISSPVAWDLCHWVDIFLNLRGSMWIFKLRVFIYYFQGTCASRFSGNYCWLGFLSFISSWHSIFPWKYQVSGCILSCQSRPATWYLISSSVGVTGEQLTLFSVNITDLWPPLQCQDPQLIPLSKQLLKFYILLSLNCQYPVYTMLYKWIVIYLFCFFGRFQSLPFS